MVDLALALKKYHSRSGSARSEKKADASRRNGKLGGRPRLCGDCGSCANCAKRAKKTGNTLKN